jgi:hypothetical protein
VCALCLAVLAGFGTLALTARYRRLRAAIVGIAAIAIVAEGWFLDHAVRVADGLPAGVVPSGALVLTLPLDDTVVNTSAQYRAVLGGYRTLNGYSGYEPQQFRALREAVAYQPPGALDAYRRAVDLYVLVSADVDASATRWIEAHARAEHLLEVNGEMLYRLPSVGPVN